MTDTAVDASRPVVGSSRNKTDGDIISSIPILVRFRSPPEIPRMNSFPTYENELEISRGHTGVCFFTFSEFLLSSMITFFSFIKLLCKSIRYRSTYKLARVYDFTIYNDGNYGL